MGIPRLTREQQARREWVIDTCALVYTGLLAANPRRRLLARRRCAARMGWFR